MCDITFFLFSKHLWTFLVFLTFLEMIALQLYIPGLCAPDTLDLGRVPTSETWYPVQKC